MGEVPFSIRVDCYSGARGEETPRRLLLGTRRIEVVEVLDRWLAPDHRYFKLRGDDGDLYLVRYDGRADRWELVLFQRGSGVPPRPRRGPGDLGSDGVA